jgi:hypothetical protein
MLLRFLPLRQRIQSVLDRTFPQYLVHPMMSRLGQECPLCRRTPKALAVESTPKALAMETAGGIQSG